MGAVYSKAKLWSPRDSCFNPQAPLTRVRVLPKSDFAPTVQDVTLPTEAAASRRNLASFISSLPMMSSLPNHEVVEDSIKLYTYNVATSSVSTWTGSEEANVDYGLPLDIAWMSKTRCLITVAATLKEGTIQAVPPTDTTIGDTVEDMVEAEHTTFQSGTSSEEIVKKDGQDVKDLTNVASQPTISTAEAVEEGKEGAKDSETVTSQPVIPAEDVSEKVEDNAQRDILQQQMQRTLTNSLRARGKPISSKALLPEPVSSQDPHDEVTSAAGLVETPKEGGQGLE